MIFIHLRLWRVQWNAQVVEFILKDVIKGIDDMLKYPVRRIFIHVLAKMEIDAHLCKFN